MYENELRIKEEEYLYSLTQKDELYLNTVTEFEEKLSELRMKNSPSIFESTETPRVSLKVSNTEQKCSESLDKFQGGWCNYYKSSSFNLDNC